MFGLDLLSASVSTIDHVTLKFIANKHPPLASRLTPPPAKNRALHSTGHAVGTLCNILVGSNNLSSFVHS